MWTVAFFCVALVCAVNGQRFRTRNQGFGGNDYGGGGGDSFDGETTTQTNWGGENDPRRHSYCDGLRNGTGYPDVLVEGCRHYLECDNGIMRVRSCAPGTVNFDPNTVACEEETEPFECNNNGHLSMRQIQDDGYVCFPRAHETNCQLFFECGAAGEDQLKECGEGTMYSEQIFACIMEDLELAERRGCQFLARDNGPRR